jgi:hypothetical protein
VVGPSSVDTIFGPHIVGSPPFWSTPTSHCRGAELGGFLQLLISKNPKKWFQFPFVQTVLIFSKNKIQTKLQWLENVLYKICCSVVGSKTLRNKKFKK